METKTIEQHKRDYFEFRGLDLGKFIEGNEEFEEAEKEWQWISELIKKEREEAKKKISKRNKLIKRLKEEMQDNVYESWGEDN